MLAEQFMSLRLNSYRYRNATCRGEHWTEADRSRCEEGGQSRRVLPVAEKTKSVFGEVVGWMRTECEQTDANDERNCVCTNFKEIH